MQVLPQWLFFLPEPNHRAASKPSGYNMTCRGVARQGEDGRPHTPLINLINLIILMQASRPRRLHTPAVIKLPAYPCGNSSPRAKPHSDIATPRGIPWRPHHHLISLISLMQAPRPRAFAHRRRRHQVARHTPAVNLRIALPSGNSSPEPNHTAAGKPTGYTVAPLYTVTLC